MLCSQCPRRCAVDRTATRGACGAPWEFLVSRVALHPYEEPPISGSKGSGTIFFGGCNLGCVYCQNAAINRGQKGRILGEDELEREMMRLVEEGAHNINLVTPTHYALPLASLLERVKPRLGVPVVYNCGGFEDVEILRRLDGLVDIYLPDFKYVSQEIAARYSGAPDYYGVAMAAVGEMVRQRRTPVFSENGLMESGVIVRHLVLPGCRTDSLRVLEALAGFGTEHLRLSLMSQYTPDFVDKGKYPELARRVTTFEYESVLGRAQELGFEGYFQDRRSATAVYTPEF